MRLCGNAVRIQVCAFNAACVPVCGVHCRELWVSLIVRVRGNAALKKRNAKYTTYQLKCKIPIYWLHLSHFQNHNTNISTCVWYSNILGVITNKCLFTFVITSLRLITFINKKLSMRFLTCLLMRWRVYHFVYRRGRNVAMWKRCPYTGMRIQRCLCVGMRSTLPRVVSIWALL